MVWYGIRQEWSMMNRPLPMLLRSSMQVLDKGEGGCNIKIEQPVGRQKFNSAMIRRNLPEFEREPTKLQYESFCLL